MNNAERITLICHVCNERRPVAYTSYQEIYLTYSTAYGVCYCNDKPGCIAAIAEAAKPPDERIKELEAAAAAVRAALRQHPEGLCYYCSSLLDD